MCTIQCNEPHIYHRDIYCKIAKKKGDCVVKFDKTDQIFLLVKNFFPCQSETDLRWLSEASCDTNIRVRS